MSRATHSSPGLLSICLGLLSLCLGLLRICLGPLTLCPGPLRICLGLFMMLMCMMLDPASLLNSISTSTQTGSMSILLTDSISTTLSSSSTPQTDNFSSLLSDSSSSSFLCTMSLSASLLSGTCTDQDSPPNSNTGLIGPNGRKEKKDGVKV